MVIQVQVLDLTADPPRVLGFQNAEVGTSQREAEDLRRKYERITGDPDSIRVVTPCARLAIKR